MPSRSEDGASSVEYGLIAGFIAAVVVAGVAALGQTNQASWDDSCREITAAMGTACH